MMNTFTSYREHSIKLPRGASVMGMRPRDSRAFEWYTASLKLFGLHIHNIEGEGVWMWKVYGASQLESKGRFKTFEDAKASLIRFLTKELKATLEEMQ